MILYHTDTGEELNIDDNYIISNYLESRFNGKFRNHAIGLDVFIGDQEEGLCCRYQSNDPEFLALVDKVNELTERMLPA